MTWSAWPTAPEVKGSGAAPSWGTNPVRKGRFKVNTELDTVWFVAVVRRDDATAPDLGRGTGAWRLSLPLPIATSFYNDDPSHAYRIGSVTIGGGDTFPDHEMRVGLHAQDIPSYGNRTHGAVVRQDAMWAGGDWPWPGDPVANVHWHGFYEIDPEEVAPILGIEL